MSDPIIQYPFDTTGTAATNLIVNEQHAVTESNYRDYFFIIPEFAPFFNINFNAFLTTNGETTPLAEGEDYTFALLYIGASRSIGLPVYGGIALNNHITSGIVTIQYQTIGGDWTVDRGDILVAIAEKNYNPRTAFWDSITSKPYYFPPINHPVEVEQIYGQQEVIDAIVQVADAISSHTAAGLDSSSLLVKHVTNLSNPHDVTAEQLGLGTVLNQLTTLAQNYQSLLSSYNSLYQLVQLHITNENLHNS